MISEILRKPEASMFFSFVVGLGISILMFHRPQSEILESAHTTDDLRATVTRIDGKCYRYRIEDASCPAAGVSL
jgi:hypothetical protein